MTMINRFISFIGMEYENIKDEKINTNSIEKNKKRSGKYASK